MIGNNGAEFGGGLFSRSGFDTIDPTTVFADPLFCDPASCEDAPTAAGDYHVAETSVCLPGASACGERIGALGAGCGPPVPLDPRSWGAIKETYR